MAKKRRVPHADARDGRLGPLFRRWMLEHHPVTFMHVAAVCGVSPIQLDEFYLGMPLGLNDEHRLRMFLCGMMWEPVIRWR